MTTLNLTNITDIDYSDIDYDRHAGYKKFATSKSILYKSNNLVTENNMSDKAVVSPILGMSMSNGLLSYYIFDILNNNIIEVTTYPEMDYISINTRTFQVNPDMEDSLPSTYIVFEMMQILNRENKLSTEAIVYLKNFVKSYLTVNPTSLDKYTKKFDLNILN